MIKKRNRTPAVKSSQVSKPGAQPPISERMAILQQQVSVQKESWSGPLPSPDQLARFDTVVPGCAERIIRMAEQEGEHSREVQMRAIKANVRLQHIGQACAFVLAAAAIYASYRLAVQGREWVAVALVGSTLATIVLAFLNRKKEE